jgi:hypothetical protein
MQDQNLDINLVIQSFQERVTQLSMEGVVKDATIKQLTSRIEELENSSISKKEEKKDNE